MAIKKPVVLTLGELEVLQSGDTIDLDTSCNNITLSNTSGGAFVPGQPVFASAAGEIDLADADTDAASKVIGLTKEAIADASTGLVCTDGSVTLTTGEWDAAAGTVGGLAFGAQYFLSDTAGAVTATAPSASPKRVVKVLIGLSTVIGLIQIHQRIKL
jgi:hypothetical protein